MRKPVPFPKNSRVGVKSYGIEGLDDDDKVVEVPSDAIGKVVDDSMKGTRIVHFCVNGQWISAIVLICQLKEAVSVQTTKSLS